MTWKIISYSVINVPPSSYSAGYALALVEDEQGERKTAQVERQHAASIAVGTPGTIIIDDAPNGLQKKINVFVPDNAGSDRNVREVAFITGSSRGIGKAIAVALAKEKKDIIINNSVESEEGRKTVKEIERLGVRCSYLPGKINDEKQVGEIVEKIIQTYGQIDILVNNAGITRDKMIENMSAEMWDEVLDVNLKGTFLCTKAVLHFMVKQGSGSIINISSIIGENGTIGQANYAASKGGMIAFTKSIARECAGMGIRANAITPGFIKTDMLNPIPPAILGDIVRQIPLRRLGRPEEIANAVVFLASDKASYITGQVIGVNGGLRM
ncbi:3-oxoacyl-[acyl-carrier-protein] reductase [Candidatus Woesearchaeota archaeon CG10_big_fil_rev_8_21_14_0_10_45_16]|nr:MAG: 3-oxoacyl-[acyl-carrier-protein] reductase [Candidatus Woesearchaeota archaeon CG10_big_fil_rev_8_21_14_0_10_45_16]